jgi:hypothetical protein
MIAAVVLGAFWGAVAAADTVTYQIAASADDTFCTSSSTSYTNNVVYWPYGADSRRDFLRWAVNLPAGAEITSAYVKVRAAATSSNTTTLQMQMVDSDNCVDFTSTPYAWAVTGPTVNWAVGALTVDTWYTGPDVKDIVQAFVNRPGYVPGNYLGLRAKLVSGTTHKQIRAWNYGTHDSGAKLEITYVTNQAPTADAGDDQTVVDTNLSGDQAVTLDGTGSTDSDGTITSYVWTEGATPLATGVMPTVTLALGTHTITLTVTDDDGATASDTVTVAVNEPPQATLTYAYGTTNTTYRYRPLYVTASYGGTTLWTMTFWVPQEGYLQATHNYWLAGEIASFKDVAYGGTAFEYSPEGTSTSSAGLLRVSGMQGDFLDGTSATDHSKQTSAYYEFTKTYTIATGVTGTTTVRLHAPYFLGGTNYITFIDGAYTIANSSGAAYDLWGTGTTAGVASLNLAHGGYTSWAFVNPTTSTTKPISHLTDVTDGHQLYAVYNWFGSTVTSSLPGFFAKHEVKNNSYASTLNLRPGLTFELRADEMNFYYNDYSNNMYGSASVSSTGGVRCSMANQPGTFGDWDLPTGQSATMTWLGTIATQPMTIPPQAVAGADQELFAPSGEDEAEVTLNGSGSYDADGSIASWVWTEGSSTLATGSTAAVTLPLGTHTITLTVTDNEGGTAEDVLLVTVKYGGPFYVDTNDANASDANYGTASSPWKTLAKAASTVEAGQTVYVKEGVYRESVTLSHSGTSSSPITFQAWPGDRVVIAGSDVLTGWTQLPQTSRNANYAHIYYKDVDWNADALAEDQEPLGYARSPNTGYWQPETGSDNTHIVNSNFTQTNSDYWVGSTMFFIDRHPVLQTSTVVSAYDPATHTITLASQILDPAVDPDGPAVGVDCLYLYNKLELMDTAGEWACEDLGGGTWRVYVWPSDGGSPTGHTYEAARRGGYVLSWGSQSYITFDGFEVRQGTNIGIGSVNGASGIVVQNCLVYDNGYKAMEFRSISGGAVRNCLVLSNGYGITFGSCTNITIEYNEIAWNRADGLDITGTTAANSSNITVRNNYIHDHYLWAHPDGVQTYNSDGTTNIAVHDVSFDSNAIIASGQGFMMAELDEAHLVNNLIMCSTTYILNGGATNTEYLGNTIGFSGYGIMSLSSGETGCTLKNNIFYTGHDNMLIGFATADTVSNYNLFFQGPGLTNYHLFQYLGTYYNALSTYVTASGDDANSLNVDPLFVNAPAYYDMCDADLLPQFTTSRVYVTHGTGTFAVNDHVEYNLDGVVRQVTAVGTNYIEFSPALSQLPTTAGVICNWKTKTDYTHNYALSASSPARGAGEGGADMGSTVNLSSYRAGDLDGDGLRDIPAWPPQ